MNPFLVAALEYAARGWRVVPLHHVVDGQCSCGRLPCGSAGKHPRTQSGFNDATLDKEQILAWWTRWPEANVGLATGVRSGLGVLDIDPRNGGNECLAELLLKYGSFDETLVVETGGGGQHLYYSLPELAEKVPSWEPACGLDFQADGKGVVAPPSIHKSGKTYSWKSPDQDLAPLPPYLIKHAYQPRARVHTPPAGTPASGVTAHLAWAEAALCDEFERVAQAAEGSRNNTLFRSAASLGEIVGGGGLDRARVEKELFRASERNGQVQQDGPAGVEATIRSGIDRGMQNPRGPKKAPHDSADGDRDLPEARVPPVVEVPAAGPGPTAPPPMENLTDTGNALRLVRHFGAVIRYELGRERWLKWDGCRWRWASPKGKEILELGKKSLRLTGEEARKLNGKKSKELRNFAIKSESARAIQAMVTLAAADETVRIYEDQLDTDPLLLTVLNGTIDLRTGELRPHCHGDLITKLAPVEIDPEAKCPVWDKTLLACSLNRPEWVAYLERCFGYALSGLTREQCLFIFHGGGQNGKDTVLLTVQQLMGDYAGTAPKGLFELKKYDAHPTELAGLKGYRLVAAPEFPEGATLDEARIKFLTGENKVSARRMGEDFSDFQPPFKFFITCNHQPRISSTDHGIQRRPRMIPWDARFEGKADDKELKAKLRAEWPGILKRLLRGCLEAQRTTGLGEPPVIQQATASYLSDMDPVARFLEECCEQGPGYSTTKQALYQAYQNWAKEAGMPNVSMNSFGRRMKEKEFAELRTSKAKSWDGVRHVVTSESAAHGGMTE